LVTPHTVSFLGANSFLAVLILTVDGDQMTTKIMLAAKGPSTAGVGADMRLKPVGIMSGHVSLQVEGTSEG
jgi:hypothetical protein